MIARCGSMTRKNTTALTFTDTLSREITSCGGTSITMMRRSTFTISCTPGMMTIRPGPLTFQKRPSMKTTPRSYSRRIRNAENTSTTITTGTKLHEINPISITLRVILLHRQNQPLDSDDLHFLSALERRAGTRLPLLAVHAHASRTLEILQRLANRADHLLLPADHAALTRLQRHKDHADEKRRAQRRHRRDQRPGNGVTLDIGIHENDRAHDKRDHAADPERAEARHEGLGHHEDDAEQDQAKARKIDGQHLKCIQREQQADAANHARQHIAGIPQFEEQSVDAEQHQEIGR